MNAKNDDGKAIDWKLNGNESRECCASTRLTKKQNKTKKVFILFISITEHEIGISFSNLLN
jgi:hypothetical protein